jgi:hypothetical protein
MKKNINAFLFLLTVLCSNAFSQVHMEQSQSKDEAFIVTTSFGRPVFTSINTKDTYGFSSEICYIGKIENVLKIIEVLRNNSDEETKLFDQPKLSITTSLENYKFDEIVYENAVIRIKGQRVWSYGDVLDINDRITPCLFKGDK